MNKEILYEILKSKSESLSSAEIESLLNEELEKSPEDMDTELVDLCLDALYSIKEKKCTTKKRRIIFTKLLAIAVIFVMIIGITIPVGAKYLNISVPEGIVTFYNDFLSIDISGNKCVDDIVNKLEEDGVNPIILPKVVFSKDTSVYDYSNDSFSKKLAIVFDFNNDNLFGCVSVEERDEKDNPINSSKISSEYNNVKYIEVNNISVLVFGNDDQSYINYYVDNIYYNILLNCDYNLALEIAKTI